eukprot:363869-Chlamydomonas_euryale.AAC.21
MSAVCMRWQSIASRSAVWVVSLSVTEGCRRLNISHQRSVLKTLLSRHLSAKVNPPFSLSLLHSPASPAYLVRCRQWHALRVDEELAVDRAHGSCNLLASDAPRASQVLHQVLLRCKRRSCRQHDRRLVKAPATRRLVADEASMRRRAENALTTRAEAFYAPFLLVNARSKTPSGEQSACGGGQLRKTAEYREGPSRQLRRPRGLLHSS